MNMIGCFGYPLSVHISASRTTVKYTYDWLCTIVNTYPYCFVCQNSTQNVFVGEEQWIQFSLSLLFRLLLYLFFPDARSFVWRQAMMEMSWQVPVYYMYFQTVLAERRAEAWNSKMVTLEFGIGDAKLVNSVNRIRRKTCFWRLQFNRPKHVLRLIKFLKFLMVTRLIHVPNAV